MKTIAENVKKAGSFLERTADIVLLIIGILISWGLTYYSARYTEVLYEETEIPLTVRDNTGVNLIVLFVTTSIFFLLRHLCKKICFKSNYVQKAVVGIAAVYVTLISIVWVAMCHVMPRADGGSLCTVAELILQGEYGTMKAPGYMSFNPHQFSLLAVIQLLFYLFGSGNYQAFQYMNALCMPLLFYSGYRLLMLIYGKLEPVLYYIVLFVSFLPLILYVPYVYGEISSITFTMVLMWQVVRYCKTGKKTSWYFGTLSIAFAYIVRANSLIVLVAVGIVLTVYAIRAAKPQAVAWLFVMFAAIFVIDGCIRTYYEKKSEIQISDGVPYISYVLMGLHDGDAGPGWFDGTTYTELTLHGYNTEQTIIDNKGDVKERLRELWEDKPLAIDFFRRKILSQWNSPVYNSIFETSNFDCTYEELPKLVRWIYYDHKDAIRAFMNRYQFVLYVCTSVMTAMTLVRGRPERQLENHILLIAVTAGFLFSMIWEAKSRYALPYVVYMIPMAAVGMWQLQELLVATAKKLYGKCS